MSKAEFVGEIYHAAIAAGLTDAAARVMASQAALESEYGNKPAGDHNYFGIKAGKSWKGETKTLTTHEVINGKRVKIKDRFRVYPTAEAGIADRVRFMESNFPGFNQAETMGNAMDVLRNGKYGRYYTAPQSEYEGAVNYINSNMLGGTPVPPAGIGVDGAGAAAGAVVPEQPPPLPRSRPERQMAPLPFPGRLQAPAGNAGPSLGAAGGSTGGAALGVTPVLGWKDGDYDHATSAGNNLIPSSDNEIARQTSQNVGGLGSVSDDRLGALTSAPPRSLGSSVGGTAQAATEVPRFITVKRQELIKPMTAAAGGAVPAGGLQASGTANAGTNGIGGMASLVGAAAGPTAAAAPQYRTVTETVPNPAWKPPEAIPATTAPAPQQGLLGALGGGLQSGMNFLGSKAQEAGTALGNAAQTTGTALAETGQKAGDILASEALKSVKVRSAFLDPIMAKAFTDKSGTIDTNPNKYGSTQGERQEAAARRQALSEGRAYVPPPNTAAPTVYKGPSSGRSFEIGKTYQSSKGPVIATAQGFQPVTVQSRDARRSQSIAEGKASQLDQFGMIR